MSSSRTRLSPSGRGDASRDIAPKLRQQGKPLGNESLFVFFLFRASQPYAQQQQRRASGRSDANSGDEVYVVDSG